MGGYHHHHHHQYHPHGTQIVVGMAFTHGKELESLPDGRTTPAEHDFIERV